MPAYSDIREHWNYQY